MTDDEIRVKLAEFEGWTNVSFRPTWGTVRGCAPGAKDLGLTTPPNYPHDLNAVHEAVRRLSGEFYLDRDGQQWNQQCEFGVQLERIVLRDNPKSTNFDIYNATARQRCQALMRAIERTIRKG